MVNVSTNEPRHRPIGVTIIAVLLAIESFVEIALGILAIGGILALGHVAAQHGHTGTRTAIDIVGIVLGGNSPGNRYHHSHLRYRIMDFETLGLLANHYRRSNHIDQACARIYSTKRLSSADCTGHDYSCHHSVILLARPLCAQSVPRFSGLK